jgi:trypsin
LLSPAIPDATMENEFQEWEGRIVGGSTASSGQFRYQASLRSSGNAHFCGGTLYSPRWVVSAAHCTIGRTTANTIVVMGAISRTTGGTTFGTARIVNHPSYNSNTLANDISLIQTSANVATTSTIAPATLGSAFVGGGVSVVASGWGQTSHPGSAAANLQFVTLTTLTNADCRGRFSAGNAARVFDNTICTFTRAGQGTCMGDSGGPLAQGNTVIGAVSWGIPCATGSPDVYARISSHRSWISSVSGV